ncbi:MAG TPA: right-handed parallel beta-helix repeat-containing protein [Solirubrobacterales bacterium]|nr:right-handed parallel beta-helix repeat-containing protein [Solirubrobacterales bacterium]
MTVTARAHPLLLAAALGALVAGCGGTSAPSATQVSAPQRALCTITIGPGEDLATRLARAQPNAVLCLRSGDYPETTVPAKATDKGAGMTTIQPAPGAEPTFAGELRFEGAHRLRLLGLSFDAGLSFDPEAADVEILENDLTGSGGLFFDGDRSQGGSSRRVLIEGNRIHGIDYTGPQDGYQGYGIKSVGDQSGFTVRGNTIKSVAADYIQTDTADDWTVEANTFLGPTLVGTHPQEHQDLWQDYAGGRDMVFRDNVARRTGTAESLLFQLTYPGDSFEAVRVENNLFDHDSAGFSVQIYQVHGLVFRDNTVVGSRFGSVFRRDPRFPPGSGYEVEGNVFAETAVGDDLGVEDGVEGWGSFDRDVTSDGSALGAGSVRDWQPRWADEIDYLPLGLPIPAGFRPPS